MHDQHGRSINSSNRNYCTTCTVCQMSAVSCGRCFANLHSVSSCIFALYKFEKNASSVRSAGTCCDTAGRKLCCCSSLLCRKCMTYLAVTGDYRHARLPQLGACLARLTGMQLKQTERLESTTRFQRSLSRPDSKQLSSKRIIHIAFGALWTKALSFAFQRRKHQPCLSWHRQEGAARYRLPTV